MSILFNTEENDSPKSGQVPVTAGKVPLIEAFAANLKKVSQPMDRSFLRSDFMMGATGILSVALLALLLIPNVDGQAKTLVGFLAALFLGIAGIIATLRSKKLRTLNKRFWMFWGGGVALLCSSGVLIVVSNCQTPLRFALSWGAFGVGAVGAAMIFYVIYQEIWGSLRVLKGLNSDSIVVEAGRDGFEVSVNDGGVVFHALLASEFNRISEDAMRAQLEKLLTGRCVSVRYDGALEILCRRNDMYTATSVMERVLLALKKAQETNESGDLE